MLSAAFHEAAHAVVSYANGCVVQQIEIHFSDELNRWEGSYRHKLAESYSSGDEPVLLPKSAKVAVAGVLAQAKHQFEQKNGCRLQFSSDNDLGDWIIFFADKKRTNTTPGVIRIKMRTDDGKIVEDEVDGSLYSGRDTAGFILCFEQIKIVPYEDLISEVLALLDNPARWNAVDRLARRLVECSPVGTNQLRQLSQAEIASELEK
jgi:hypothetical protein